MPDLDHYVEAFESAMAGEGGAVRIEEYLPPHGDPLRDEVLCELVRVDLEYAFDQGRAVTVEEYQQRFPTLFADPGRAKLIAFEESRLRKQVGTPSDSRERHEVVASEVEKAAGVYRACRGQVLGGDGADSLSRSLAAAGVPRGASELFRDLYRRDPDAADRLSVGLASFPKIGERFLDFRIRAELGRGAFGRVYLAQQGDLADRPVALKVAPDVGGEARALAQLRHTNVVPIHSVHRAGPLRAVCMPYLGSATLADVLAELRRHDTLPASGEGLLSSWRIRGNSLARTLVEQVEAQGEDDEVVPPTPPTLPPQVEALKGLGYVQAVLWLGRRMAEGLAHAHDRGILHRDLKPANILFSEDGEPVLLDFNLADDLKMPASASMLGGTLPYMAPEHLVAFRDDAPGRAVDARADVYALAVILHELLTGRLPYEVRKGPVEAVLARMLEDRQRPIRSPRGRNPSISPAVESILLKGLDPDPDRRYPDARSLAEDLRRQLDDLPLKYAPEPSLRERAAKWARRHPRLTSASTLGAFAAVLLGVCLIGAWKIRADLKGLQAVRAVEDLTRAVREAEFLLGGRDADPDQIAGGLAMADRSLAEHDGSPHLSYLSTSEQSRLRGLLGELGFLQARALSWTVADRPQSDTARSAAGRLPALLALAESAVPDAVPDAAIRQLRADLAGREGREDEAQTLRNQAASDLKDLPPKQQLLMLDRVPDRQALATLQALSDKDASDPLTWLLLGNQYVRMNRSTQAMESYRVGLAMEPDQLWARFNRAALALEQKDFAAAEADFGRVLKLRPDLMPALLNRALARIGLKSFDAAKSDLDALLSRPDAPTRAWFIRAKVEQELHHPDLAARDRAEGLNRVPTDDLSYVARGLAKLPDARAALADFDAALALNRRCLTALQNKASILSEYLNKPTESVTTLDTLLGYHPTCVPALAGRGVLHARAGRKAEALADAKAALDFDDSAATAYQVAGIYALTGDLPHALDLLAGALIRDPAWLPIIPRDPDLASIQGDARLKAIVRSAETLLNRKN